MGVMSLAESADKLEWPKRALFGILLAGLALAATFAGGFIFAGFISLIAVAAVREWHRMVGGKRYALVVAASGLAIIGALAAGVLVPGMLWPVTILALGSVFAALFAAREGARPTWNAAGTLYVGLPSLSLVALRVHASYGVVPILLIFIAVWAADTGALVLGRLIGGPKLVPVLSPNKTWAGFIAGTVLAAAAVALYAELAGGSFWRAALLGAGLGLAGHSGDLFESWVKRKVGCKNSGGLIPGHGGVLDRVDSTLFAAPLAALLVFVFGLDPLWGGHP
jgi:phosphatidate cytidylyltransferase